MTTNNKDNNNKEKLLEDMDISQAELTNLNFHSFARMLRSAPESTLSRGDFVFLDNKYFMVAEIIGNACLLKTLQYDPKSGYFRYSGAYEIRDLDGLVSVELPTNHAPLPASALFASVAANQQKQPQSKTHSIDREDWYTSSLKKTDKWW